MRIDELFQNTLGQVAVGAGAEKALYPIDSGEFLLAVPIGYHRQHLSYQEAILGRLNRSPESILVKMRQDYPSIMGVMESTTALYTSTLRLQVFFEGLRPGSYGQAMVSSRAQSRDSSIPAFAIHPKIEGETFDDYASRTPNLYQEMASWEQETYTDLLRQVVVAGKQGHSLDFGLDNRFRRNLMISFSQDKPNQPNELLPKNRTSV